MKSTIRIILAGAALTAGAIGLSGCGKGGTSGETNIVEMNAMDGSMNDMTVVDSATLDAAGSPNIAGDNAASTENASNAT